MEYTQITFITESAAQNEMLIALLSNLGFYGFEEEADLLKAYILQDNFNKKDLDEIATTYNIKYDLKDIKQQNWNAAWESSFEPVIINDFAVIRADFHRSISDVKYDIVITPKMSFGTGHHATTHMMIEQMSTVDFMNKKVLDFGTGTGVLAILAEKMGAKEITAIDNDDWSIENARENIENNKSENISVEKAGSIHLNKLYDIILANINLNVILENMQFIAAASKAGTQIILSGFLIEDENKIKTSLISNQLLFNNLIEKDGWICMKVNK